MKWLPPRTWAIMITAMSLPLILFLNATLYRAISSVIWLPRWVLRFILLSILASHTVEAISVAYLARRRSHPAWPWFIQTLVLGIPSVSAFSSRPKMGRQRDRAAAR